MAELVQHTLTYRTITRPHWMRHSQADEAAPEREITKSQATDGRTLAVLLRFLDVPDQDFAEKLAPFVETSFSSTTQKVMKRNPNEDRKLSNTFWATPSLWICPVCRRTKSTLFCDATVDIQNVHLHLHHDHLRDIFGKYRFKDTYLCADCNGFDARLKRDMEAVPNLPQWSDIKIPSDIASKNRLNLKRRVCPFFSFAPTELRKIYSFDTIYELKDRALQEAVRTYRDHLKNGIGGLLSFAEAFMAETPVGSAHFEGYSKLATLLGVDPDSLYRMIEHVLSPQDEKLIPGMNVDCYVTYDRDDTKNRYSDAASIPDSIEFDGLDVQMERIEAKHFYAEDVFRGLRDLAVHLGELPSNHAPAATKVYKSTEKLVRHSQILDMPAESLSEFLECSIDGPWGAPYRIAAQQHGLFKLEVTFGTEYMKTPEDWRCPVCDRLKHETMRRTNKNTYMFGCKVYQCRVTDNLEIFPRVVICDDCETSAKTINGELRRSLTADDLVGLTAVLAEATSGKVESVRSFCLPLQQLRLLVKNGRVNRDQKTLGQAERLAKEYGTLSPTLNRFNHADDKLHSSRFLAACERRGIEPDVTLTVLKAFASKPRFISPGPGFFPVYAKKKETISRQPWRPKPLGIEQTL